MSTWTKVQSVTGNFVSAASGAPSLTGVAAGNMITVELSYFQGGSTGTVPTTPTDSNGTQTVANAPAGAGTSGTWTGVCIWNDDNTPGGTHNFVVSVPNPGNNVGRYTVTEWNGGLETGSLDKAPAASNATTAQTNTSTTTGTLSNANELVIVGIAVISGAGVTNAGITDPPTNYTSANVNNNTSTNIAMEHSYRIKSSDTSAEAPSFSWTDATTARSQVTIASFIPASSSPVVPPLMGQILT